MKSCHSGFVYFQHHSLYFVMDRKKEKEWRYKVVKIKTMIEGGKQYE